MGPPERRGRDRWSKRPDKAGWSKSKPRRWRAVRVAARRMGGMMGPREWRGRAVLVKQRCCRDVSRRAGCRVGGAREEQGLEKSKTPRETKLWAEHVMLLDAALSRKES